MVLGWSWGGPGVVLGWSWEVLGWLGASEWSLEVVPRWSKMVPGWSPRGVPRWETLFTLKVAKTIVFVMVLELFKEPVLASEREARASLRTSERRKSVFHGRRFAPLVALRGGLGAVWAWSGRGLGVSWGRPWAVWGGPGAIPASPGGVLGQS